MALLAASESARSIATARAVGAGRVSNATYDAPRVDGPRHVQDRGEDGVMGRIHDRRHQGRETRSTGQCHHGDRGRRDVADLLVACDHGGGCSRGRCKPDQDGRQILHSRSSVITVPRAPCLTRTSIASATR